MKKKFNSNVYFHNKYVNKKNITYSIEDPNGFLFAGVYKTKILPEDLPEYYIKVYMYHKHGFISAKNVKQLEYVPDYSSSHFLKDDFLYISYKDKIQKDVDKFGFVRFVKYDEFLYGNAIIDFIEAVKKYSNIDTSKMEKEIQKKKEWYIKKYGEDKI